MKFLEFNFIRTQKEKHQKKLNKFTLGAILYMVARLPENEQINSFNLSLQFAIECERVDQINLSQLIRFLDMNRQFVPSEVFTRGIYSHAIQQFYENDRRTHIIIPGADFVLSTDMERLRDLFNYQTTPYICERMFTDLVHYVEYKKNLGDLTELMRVMWWFMRLFRPPILIPDLLGNYRHDRYDKYGSYLIGCIGNINIYHIQTHGLQSILHLDWLKSIVIKQDYYTVDDDVMFVDYFGQQSEQQSREMISLYFDDQEDVGMRLIFDAYRNQDMEHYRKYNIAQLLSYILIAQHVRQAGVVSQECVDIFTQSIRWVMQDTVKLTLKQKLSLFDDVQYIYNNVTMSYPSPFYVLELEMELAQDVFQNDIQTREQCLELMKTYFGDGFDQTRQPFSIIQLMVEENNGFIVQIGPNEFQLNEGDSELIFQFFRERHPNIAEDYLLVSKQLMPRWLVYFFPPAIKQTIIEGLKLLDEKDSLEKFNNYVEAITGANIKYYIVRCENQIHPDSVHHHHDETWMGNPINKRPDIVLFGDQPYIDLVNRQGEMCSTCQQVTKYKVATRCGCDYVQCPGCFLQYMCTQLDRKHGETVGTKTCPGCKYGYGRTSSFYPYSSLDQDNKVNFIVPIDKTIPFEQQDKLHLRMARQGSYYINLDMPLPDGLTSKFKSPFGPVVSIAKQYLLRVNPLHKDEDDPEYQKPPPWGVDNANDYYSGKFVDKFKQIFSFADGISPLNIILILIVLLLIALIAFAIIKHRNIRRAKRSV